MYIHLLELRGLRPSRKERFMRTAICLSGALLVFGVFLASLSGALGAGQSNHAEASFHRPELEYLKAVNSVAPPQDPQLLFLLMAQYSNANLQGEGAEFFSARLPNWGSWPGTKSKCASKRINSGYAVIRSGRGTKY